MRIKCAAILHDGVIYEGKNHAEIGLKMLDDGVCEPPYPGGQAQGFVTECGKFVSREEALDIAIEAKQVIPGKTVNRRALFSEDLNYPHLVVKLDDAQKCILKMISDDVKAQGFAAISPLIMDFVKAVMPTELVSIDTKNDGGGDATLTDLGKSIVAGIEGLEKGENDHE